MRYGMAILVMTLCGAMGAFFFKKGAQEFKGFWGMLLNIKVYIGGACYVAGALINIALLRYMDYSIVYPMTAITYIWSLVLAHLFMKEAITANKIFGIVVICVGIATLMF